MTGISSVRGGGACLAVAFVVWAQGPKVVTLRPPTAASPEEFITVGSVRELADGRLLVNDPRDGRIVAMDLTTGVVQQLGRRGAGPGEYQGALPLRAIGGDSTIMVDLSLRWLVFHGAKIVATLSSDVVRRKGMSGLVQGADTLGHIWSVESPTTVDRDHPRSGSRAFSLSDSNLVVRANRKTGAIDTVTRLGGIVMRREITTDSLGRLRSAVFVRPPLAVPEQAVLFRDGWFAVARNNPYRIDWISPVGGVVTGAPIQRLPIRMTQREQTAYLDRLRSQATGPIPRDAKRTGADVDALRDQFPKYLPPFTNDALVAADDGHLLVLHAVSADYPRPRYDVIDRRGRLVAVLEISQGERIVSVTNAFAYVAWKDRDDIVRLRRHPWIPFAP